MAGPSSGLIPLEPRLPACDALTSLDIARQSQLYTHLDQPKHAAKVTCSDAKNLQLLSSGNGLQLFIHRARPIVFVQLIGRLVGIEEKDKRIIWLVDDGTDVVAVHHTYKEQAVAVSAQDEPKAIPRASIKGKERARGDYQYEIPSQYQLPPLPAPPRASRRHVKTYTPPVDPVKAFEIGDLLSIIGRVELWKWGGERIVYVDDISLREVKCKMQLKEERSSSISLANDANEEPEHLLQALRLSATEYSRPFYMPESMSYQQSTWLPPKLREMKDNAAILPRSGHNGAALRVMEDVPAVAPQRKALRVMEDISEDKAKFVRKKTLGVPNRLTPSTREENQSVREAKSAIKVSQEEKEKLKTSLDITFIQNESPPASQVSITSIQTDASPRHRRQLRKYTKLNDSSLTESTFRVYVEKHIVDHCSGEVSLDESSPLLHTPMNPKKRRSRGNSGCDMIGPPAFTLEYLMMIDDLYEHARRTVEVASKKREEKRRRKAALNKSPITPIASKEKVKDKVKRLYGNVMQAMMMDGIIVLANPRMPIKPPFDGKGNNIDNAITLSSSDTERESFRANYRKDLDAYQVVTPALLALPIHQIISNTSNANLKSAAQILQKLQIMDERWHYIREESIQDCISIYLQQAVVQ